jgi:hypothetical protein
MTTKRTQRMKRYDTDECPWCRALVIPEIRSDGASVCPDALCRGAWRTTVRDGKRKRTLLPKGT